MKKSNIQYLYFAENGFMFCYFRTCKRCKEGFFTRYPSASFCIQCNKTLYLGKLLDYYPFYNQQEKNDVAKAIITINKIEDSEYGKRKFFDNKEKFMEFIKKLKEE